MPAVPGVLFHKTNCYSVDEEAVTMDKERNIEST